MSFLREIKRRKVFQVAAVYAVVAWLLIQIVATIEAPLNLPDWFDTLVIVSLVIGFPIALILSWAFDVTPEGVVRDTGGPPQRGSKTIAFVVLGLATIAFSALLYREFSPEAGPPPGSIAVLPFENQSPDANDAFFTDGIHDDLLLQLTKISSLRVIPRTSVLDYRNTTKNMREIGEELSVAFVLTGGVYRSGDVMRINVQLNDVDNDVSIWAEGYDRELTAENVFAVRTEITEEIAQNLQATISPEDRQRLSEIPTDNWDALENYLQGRLELEKRVSLPIRRAIEHFNEAINLDPDYAEAYAGLADAYMVLSEYSPDADRTTARAEAMVAAGQAHEMDARLPEALTSLGWSRMIHEYAWEEAETLLREALEIEPR